MTKETERDFMKHMGVVEYGIPEEWKDEIPAEETMYDWTGGILDVNK